MMDHFMNELMGFFNSANCVIFPKMLVIMYVIFIKQQECRKIFKQSHCDKINQNEPNSMYGQVACPKRNGYLTMVAAIHSFTISPFDYI